MGSSINTGQYPHQSRVASWRFLWPLLHQAHQTSVTILTSWAFTSRPDIRFSLSLRWCQGRCTNLSQSRRQPVRVALYQPSAFHPFDRKLQPRARRMSWRNRRLASHYLYHRVHHHHRHYHHHCPALLLMLLVPAP
eukprot:COSAG02_NODE_5157_length_4582_cov_29.351996_6_plen_136_part_00